MATEEHIVKIVQAGFITHNVRRFTLEKPAGYRFEIFRHAGRPFHQYPHTGENH